MNRGQIIDYLEDRYNTRDRYENLEQTMLEVSGLDDLDDSDPREGMYSQLATSELREVMLILDERSKEESGPSRQLTLEVTKKEYDVLKEILVETSFSFDRDIREITNHLLDQLNDQSF